MGGLSELLRRKKGPGPAQTQTPAEGMQTMASLVGNQGMISMMNAQRSPGRGTRPFDDEVNQELEQSILSRMPSNQAAAQPAPEQQAAQASGQEEQAQEMAEMQEEPEMARASLSDLYAQLKASKRGGLHIHGGNSQLYTAVMDALGGINTAMKQTFTQDIKSNMQMLIDMEHRYQELISACAAYTKRDPGTRAGKIRKDLVTQIQSRASTDLVALSAVRTDFCALPAEQQSGKGWNELLDQSRTIRLSVKDFSQLGKAEGGAASEVYKLTDSNATVKNAAGQPMELGEMHFFKPEDEFDMTKKSTAAQVVENVLKRYPKLSKKEQDAIRQWAMAGGRGRRQPDSPSWVRRPWLPSRTI